MLTKQFLLQSARDRSLTPKQQEVFLLKILDNLPYAKIEARLGISKAACLKRMGEVYDKFEIEGSGRGKEQRLRKHLLQLLSQARTSNSGLVPSVDDAIATHTSSSLVPPITEPALSLPALSGHSAWIQSLQEWFICLDYKIENQPVHTESYVEWVVKVRARRGWDQIVIHGIQGEAQSSHIRALREAVYQHSAVEGWVVSPRRISPTARKEVTLPNNDDLFCYTFDELIDQEIGFDKYFESLEATIQDKEIATKYIQLACTKAEFDANANFSLGAAAVDHSHYGEEEGWIDGYIDRWLDDPAKEHISVLGEFGTGKTWFALHYGWQALKKYKLAQQRGLERPRLPLIIPLRDCAKAATLESLVSEYFFRKYQISLPDYRVFEQLNRMGKLLLIFDGFDEMASKVDYQSMINNFWQLAKVVVPGSKVILTCRTEHFPDARQSRSLLNAELQASTDSIIVQSPKFEVLELEKFSEEQVKKVVASRIGTKTAESLFNNSDLLELARRPLMLELILETLPTIQAEAVIDLPRIYLYAVSQKMEQDIKAERTFTSLADKLYFLCELSWEMLSTEQMSLSYKRFPDRIHQFFGSAVESGLELDHWHYDMMGQTMLIRNERGEYAPAHRSFLEFFVAFKLVAELGCLAADFLPLAQAQSHVDNTKEPEQHQWSGYFCREKTKLGEVISIAPLADFSQESISRLMQTLGHRPLSKALLDLMLPMMASNQPGKQLADYLLETLLSIKDNKSKNAGYLAGNLITLLLKVSSSALQGKDLSNRFIYGVDFTGVSLRNVDFTGSRLEKCIFPEGWSGDLSVVYSKDGRYFAIVDSTGEIFLRDVASGKQLWKAKEHTDWIRALAFDAKCQTLATGSHDQSIKLWDVQTGKLLKTINAESRVYSLTFSQEYDLLASGGDTEDVQIWDTRTWKRRQLVGHKTWIGAVVFGKNADGEVLASGSDDGEIRLWNVADSRCLKILDNGDRSVHALSFDAESQTLASGSSDRTVKLWDVNTGDCVQHLKGHSDWVRTVALSFGGRLLVSGSNDRSIKLWDTQTGECIRTIEAHETRVWSVAFNPNNKVLASGSDDRSIKLWNVDTGECLKTFFGNSRGLWSIAFSADGQTLYCGSDDHRVQSWHVRSERNLNAFKGHKGRVRTISLSERHQILASGSDDKTIKLWDIQTGDCLKTLENHRDWVWSVDFSADGETLASSSLDNSVMLWNTQTREHLKTLTGHTKFVWTVEWSPVAAVLASGSADQTVRLWDAATGKCLHVLKGHRHQVASVSFSPDGLQLASASDDGEIKIWDVHTGDCFLTVDDKSQLRTITFSPDGQYLASAGLDTVVRLRQASTGELVRDITTHDEPVLSLSFSPDGKTLASGGESGILHLSELDTDNCSKKLSVDSPYKGMNLDGATGLSESQSETLASLGALNPQSERPLSKV
ncbi:MAG: NACHT domain-containing protein [Cyanobacteria bacterium J06643_4]